MDYPMNELTRDYQNCLEAERQAVDAGLREDLLADLRRNTNRAWHALYAEWELSVGGR